MRQTEKNRVSKIRTRSIQNQLAYPAEDFRFVMIIKGTYNNVFCRMIHSIFNHLCFKRPQQLMLKMISI